MWSAPNISRASWKRPQRLTALPLAYVGESNEWESAVQTAGCATAFFANFPRSDRRERHRLSRLLDRQSRPRSAPASKPPAPMRAPCARRSRSRCGTRSTAPGWNCKRYGNGPDLARGALTLPALGAGMLAAFRRLGLPHHAAQRCLLVHAARRLSGARRQHRAHPGRQISSAAAGPGACRRPARLFPVGGDPARRSRR